MTRLLLLFFAVGSAFACSGSEAGNFAPLVQPMSADDQVYDGIQARVTSYGFDFLESNLIEIVNQFMGENWQTIQLPPTPYSPGIGIDILFCPNGCTLNLELLDAWPSLIYPNRIRIEAIVNVTGSIEVGGDVDCDAPLNVSNKTLSTDVNLMIGQKDPFLFVDIENISLDISLDDFTVECPWYYDWAVELLKVFFVELAWDNLILPNVEKSFNQAEARFGCLPCDFYQNGCPPGSSCGDYGDDRYCVQDNTCRIKPQGLVGEFNSQELPFAAQNTAVLVAPGQRLDSSVDPMVQPDSLELRILGGAQSERDTCVPKPTSGIPYNFPPPRLNLGNTIPGDGRNYMTGILISDALLDWMLYKTYLAGFLCLSVSTDNVEMLNSGTFLFLKNLSILTADRTVPMKISLRPSQIPYVDIGAGTFATDPEGKRVVDDPLITLHMEEANVDIYVLLDDNWTRIFTVTLDILLPFGVDLTDDNLIIPMLDAQKLQESIESQDILVSNWEVLGVQPNIDDIIGLILGTVLPAVTENMEGFEIPPLENFQLHLLKLQGEPFQAQDYEYAGIYANLQMAPSPE